MMMRWRMIVRRIACEGASSLAVRKGKRAGTCDGGDWQHTVYDDRER